MQVYNKVDLVSYFVIFETTLAYLSMHLFALNWLVHSASPDKIVFLLKGKNLKLVLPVANAFALVAPFFSLLREHQSMSSTLHLFGLSIQTATKKRLF